MLSLSAAWLVSGCKDAPVGGTSSAAALASSEPLDVRIASPRFDLVDEKGHAFSSETMKGKVWIVDFIFTSCPSVCPRLTHKMAGVLEKTKDVPGIHFLSISVDPENDTPEKLTAFVAKNGVSSDRWSLLTGPIKDVEATVKGFKIGAQKSPEGLLSHDEHFVLVDQEGVIRGYFVADDEGLADLEDRARGFAK